MASPGISVILPVRNGAPYLDQAVASVAGQTDPDFEFFIIDDHSTDDTPRIVRDWCARDSRVHAISAPAQGIVPALNAGLAAARGDLIARMDADDIALPDRFARQRQFLAENPQVTALGTCADEIDAEGRLRGTVTMPDGIEPVHAALAHGSPLLHPSVMMRRDAVLEIGGYRDCCTLAEDYDLWLRLARAGRIANLPDRLMMLRRHEGQVSRQRRLQQRAAAALARRLAEEGEQLPDAFHASAPTTLALLAYLGQATPGRSLDRRAARDYEVMLRSAFQKNPLPLMELFSFRRAVLSLGVRRSAATLFKLAAGR